MSICVCIITIQIEANIFMLWIAVEHLCLRYLDSGPVSVARLSKKASYGDHNPQFIQPLSLHCCVYTLCIHCYSCAQCAAHSPYFFLTQMMKEWTLLSSNFPKADCCLLYMYIPLKYLQRRLFLRSTLRHFPNACICSLKARNVTVYFGYFQKSCDISSLQKKTETGERWSRWWWQVGFGRGRVEEKKTGTAQNLGLGTKSTKRRFRSQLGSNPARPTSVWTRYKILPPVPILILYMWYVTWINCTNRHF